jgi:hypothetical protein
VIFYMADPLDLLKDIKTPEQRSIALPSGGLVNIEILDKQQARVVGIISTDPMDYMDINLQPGSVLDIEWVTSK